MGNRFLQKMFTGKRNQPASIDLHKIPQHVAIIMDGNGRWAKVRGLPRMAGHHAGMKNVKRIAMAAHDIGVNVLTMYAFSTENWKRPKEEIEFLLSLPQEFFPLEIGDLMENNIQVRMMGHKENLPEHTLQPVQNAIEMTKNNTGMILNFAMNYGSRKEMLHSVKEIAAAVHTGQLQVDDIDEAVYESHLLSCSLPDPDLLIRTSGEQRISNFMLWQLAYSELWFTDAYWPDFTREKFLEAIGAYQMRARRFGGI